MIIKPSAAIRKNYNEISKLCRETGEPVYLTKNGEGDLVVMDIAAFSQRESMIRLRENLLAVEEDRATGSPGYSIDDVNDMLKESILKGANGRKK